MKKGDKTNKALSGQVASGGIAIGRAVMIDHKRVRIPKVWIHDGQVSLEEVRFRRAVLSARKDIEILKKKLCRVDGHEQIAILESHLMMVSDPALLEGTIGRIRNDKINAEWAYEQTVNELERAFLKAEDGYFSERQSDLAALAEKVQAHLIGKSRTVGRIPEGAVVIAKELTPVDTIELVKSRPLAFVTKFGGRAGHVAIVARSLNIPCIVGVEEILEVAVQGDELVVDGERGLVFISPNDKLKADYGERLSRELKQRTLLLKSAKQKVNTSDGMPVRIAANIEWLDDIQNVKRYGAEGIGLFRTEYLFLGRASLPDEGTQFDHYKKVLKSFPSQSVTVRTLDIGGDKRLDPDYSPEVNPALGVRGIRYCFKEKRIFYTQLRALLRASVYGELRLLFSMINSVEEVRKVRQILVRIRKELDEEGKKVAESIPIGIMVETPAAALTMDLFAKEVDFFSVGTNDLTQYTLAVDRDNDEVSSLYDPLHPGHLRLLKHIVDVADASGKPLSICGELAGDPFYLYLLLGLGIRELSMNPVSIPGIKYLLSRMGYADAQRFVEKVLQLKTAREAGRAMEMELARLFPRWFKAESRSFSDLAVG